MLQLKGFFFSWTNEICFFRSTFCEKKCLQMLHTNVFSTPWTISIWLIKYCLDVKLQSQILHLKRFSSLKFDMLWLLKLDSFKELALLTVSKLQDFPTAWSEHDFSLFTWGSIDFSLQVSGSFSTWILCFCFNDSK